MSARHAAQWTIPYAIVHFHFFLVLSNAFSSSFVRQRPGRTSVKRSVTWLQSTKSNPRADTAATTDDDDGVRTTDVCTVQILMSDTGGGHRASANALEDALEYLYPGKFEFDIVDIYTEYGPFWPINDVVRMYKFMAENSWTWDLFYQFGETDFGLELNKLMLDVFCYEPFEKCMTRTFDSTEKRADVVVSVHPLCQDLPLKILSDLDARHGDNYDIDDPKVFDFTTHKHSDRTTPFLTVVTDLGGAHMTWFNPNVDKCFVPSEILNEKAQSRGLCSSSQISQYGLPIRRGFWPEQLSNTTTQEPLYSVREQLGLDDIPTVLIVGGGDGMGGVVDIATNVGTTLGNMKNCDSNVPQYQMVVVCGNNRDAQQHLNKIKWPKGINVSVQGFVSNMDEWMKASDCLVTKAGPGTIAEAAICGLPCLLFAFLPGQEEGNIRFVEESGFGKYSSNPKEIAETVSSWLKSPKDLHAMKQAALSAANPSATLTIAKDLAEIAFASNMRKRLRP